MANYEEARGKSTNTQLSTLKSTEKSKTGTMLRLNKKSSEDEELSHEWIISNNKTNN